MQSEYSVHRETYLKAGDVSVTGDVDTKTKRLYVICTRAQLYKFVLGISFL